MASADLREELTCPVCLDVYTDPVTLRCGHNYCWVCIDRVLDTQEGSGVYSCPDCREEFQGRPALHRNITLRNIAERFPSTRPEQEKTGVFCTYCIHSPVPAVKSCLHCEASLCDDHLRVHSKSPEHVLSDPTTALGNRKCSVHNEILKYYCTEDSACICVTCYLAGDHRGHQVETLDEASEKKKEKLRNILQKLLSKRAETERTVQSLEERRRDVQGTAAGERERVTALIRDIRRQLEDLEKRVLSEISSWEERVSLSVSDLIRQLEIKKDEMSRKMSHIEELGNMTDPLTVLQESDTGNLCDTEEGDNEDRERRDKQVHNRGNLHEVLDSDTLCKGLSDIMTFVKNAVDSYVKLDENTAAKNLRLSRDRKTVHWSKTPPDSVHVESPERFQNCAQVLSTKSFSSGRHCWEVETSNYGEWRVGMSYSTIDRGGDQSYLGCNKKSWCLCRSNNNQYSVVYDSKEIRLIDSITYQRCRIYLDYEAGRLSFYELHDRIRHLHTFIATFTEPLYVAFYVYGVNAFVKIRT